ncbi:ATP-binding protein [Maricaulis parjimensis]|uniref:ATP-binding protein n=1 Tax=Maricaulis parjimensis TaxID=144023 RepID=UPI0019395048|nr:ATP-binding protein [Maricaulis parjimensis]
MDLERLISSAPALFGSASMEGRFVSLSPQWQDVLGFELKTLIGAEFLDYVHPDDRAQTEAALAEQEDGTSVLGFINRYRCKDGSYRHIEWRSKRSDDGLVYFIALDVTERVTTQESLKVSLERLQQVSEIGGMGGWELDVETSALHWDKRTKEIHEVPADFQPELSKAIEFYAPEARDMVAQAVDQALAKGERWNFEAPLITATGKRIWVHASGAPTYQNGRLVRLSGIFQDITAEKTHALELEDALKQAEDMQALAEEASKAAEAASRAKSQFLANMSHEIRTPLNGLMGITQLLKRTELSGKQVKFVETLEATGQTLRSLIENILDFSRIEAGYIALENAPLRLDELVTATCQVASVEASQKGLELGCAIDPGVEPGRLGDRKRMAQVLLNLVANAVKFTDSGSVRVQVTEPRDGVIRFAVTDTGPGVTKEAQAIIFDRFAQADSSSRRFHDGAGLGLAISKELVDLAGGSIGLESTPGKGSTFWFDWPLPVDERAETPQTAEPDESAALRRKLQGRILVAEDKETNFLVLKAALERDGLDVLHARTGVEAVELNAQHAPQLILMDLHMPGMTGDEAIDIIRKDSRSRPSIFVVTADATPGARARLQELDIAGVFIKPFDLDQILSAVGDALAAHAIEG